MSRYRVVVAAAAGFLALVAGTVPAQAKVVPTPVYDATATPLPGNVPSEGFEATGNGQFGDWVQLAGSARTLSTVTVTMSSWACQSGAWNSGDCATAKGAKFNVPITLNVYAAPIEQQDGSYLPGSLLASNTTTFAIPYRPSANVSKCNRTNDSLGEWYSKPEGTCYNGKATNITFNFNAYKLHLPDQVVVGVAYNTSDYGAQPYGQNTACHSTSEGCAYDSLNVGLNDDPNAPYLGSEPAQGTVFQDSQYRGQFCDNTPVTGVFNLDSPTSACWRGIDSDGHPYSYTPAIKISATGATA